MRYRETNPYRGKQTPKTGKNYQCQHFVVWLGCVFRGHWFLWLKYPVGKKFASTFPFCWRFLHCWIETVLVGTKGQEKRVTLCNNFIFSYRIDGHFDGGKVPLVSRLRVAVPVTCACAARYTWVSEKLRDFCLIDCHWGKMKLYFGPAPVRYCFTMGLWGLILLAGWSVFFLSGVSDAIVCSFIRLTLLRSREPWPWVGKVIMRARLLKMQMIHPIRPMTALAAVSTQRRTVR